MELLLNAGLVVKIVLLILLYFSVVSWAIILFKTVTIRKAAQDTERFLSFFWSKKRFDTVAQHLKDFPSTPLTTLFREGYREFLKIREGQSEERDELMTADLGITGNVARTLRRASTMEIHRLEKNLTFLATTGSTAPFIGLFGTVWGIMDSFIGIGKTGSASLAVVAPGISEALVATALGLAAAIPAVVAYNHFLNKVNVLGGEMDSFSQEFLNIVEHAVRRG